MSTLFHLFESLPFTFPQLNALKNIDMIITVEELIKELIKEEENVSPVVNPLNPSSAQNLISPTSFPGPFPFSALKMGKRPCERGCNFPIQNYKYIVKKVQPNK